MLGYYRRILLHFNIFTAPITDLYKEEKPEEVLWMDKCQNAFYNLKDELTTHPVLANWDFENPSGYMQVPLIQGWVLC